MTVIRDAAPEFPIKQAWRDVRDIAKVKDWQWPPYVTINCRWNALPKAEQMMARYGRTQDFWTDLGDGKPVRITLLALINVASIYVLAPSESAVDTVRLIRNVCEQHGIFDRLYTYNGSSFAGHLVAGGNVSRFRNKIAERTFASLSRVIDDRPEFKGAHAGHSAGATPTSEIVPVPFAKVQAVLAREVARHNAEGGRNSQGASGRSYRRV